MRRAGVVLMLLSLPLLGTMPALASTGVRVGPARQMIGPDDGEAVIYVSNPTRTSVTITPSEWAHLEGKWSVGNVPVIVAPASPFELGPREQRELRIGLTPTTAPCRLVGVGFSVQVPVGEGVTAQGVTIAQLALRGQGGTEADCLAILPKPPTTPGGPAMWWLVIPAGLVLVAGWLVKRAKT